MQANAVKLSLLLLITMIGFSAVFYGCSRKENIKKEKIAKIYVDLLVIKETYGGNPQLLSSKKDSLFTKYDIKGNEYNAALKGFTVDNEKWEDFFKIAFKYLDTLRQQNKVIPPDSLLKQS